MKYIIHKTLIRMPNTKYFLVQIPSQEKTSSPNSKLKKNYLFALLFIAYETRFERDN